MLDLLAAARATPSAERRALYLSHALDEERHARSFAARARQLGLRDPGAADFDDLYERLGEVGFLAFVHRGEARGRAQFAEHRRVLLSRGDEQGARQFEAILVDEERHERYTGDLLSALTTTPRRALRAAALRDALWRWRRVGRFLSGLVFAVLASVLFVLLLPFSLADRLRARHTGWRVP
ncbi:MAG: ferritin-like domain-containing protein [Polyangia bacterium]